MSMILKLNVYVNIKLVNLSVYMQSTSWEMLGWMKHKLESRLPGEVSVTRYADVTTLMAESEEELKGFLMKVKEENEKAGLKCNKQKTRIMVSCPITLLKIDGVTVETMRDFIFLGSKITADGNYSHEIKRFLYLGRKGTANLDNILKSRDIILPTKFCLVKKNVFSSIMYGCESWTVIKLSAEELMLSNCVVGEDAWESLGLQGGQTSQS